jgi:hypothetical protein
MKWYFISSIFNSRFIPIVVIVSIGFFIGFRFLDSWKDLKTRLHQMVPMISLMLLYTVFLVIASTMTAHDQINNRLMSPVFIPLTLMLMILIQKSIVLWRVRKSRIIAANVLLIGYVILLVYPNVSGLLEVMTKGEGYTHLIWREGETIKYLQKNQNFESNDVVYTNDPEAAYILADITAKMVPLRTEHNATRIINTPAGLKGSWPEEGRSRLIWFDNSVRPNIYTVDDLREIATVKLITSFSDGAIYSIAKR